MSATGWWDIGYNFLVGENGYVYEGRGWDSMGAHARNWNGVSIGIAFIGTFSNRTPNEAAINAARQLISSGVNQVRSAVACIGLTEQRAPMGSLR